MYKVATSYPWLCNNMSLYVRNTYQQAIHSLFHLATCRLDWSVGLLIQELKYLQYCVDCVEFIFLELGHIWQVCTSTLPFDKHRRSSGLNKDNSVHFVLGVALTRVNRSEEWGRVSSNIPGGHTVSHGGALKILTQPVTAQLHYHHASHTPIDLP